MRYAYSIFLLSSFFSDAGRLPPQKAKKKSSIRRQRRLLRRSPATSQKVPNRPISPQIHLNQVEALLEWKKQVTFLPITVNYHVGQEETPIEELHTLKCTKSVANENLLSVAEDVEAIFINIDWDKPGQTLK